LRLRPGSGDGGAERRFRLPQRQAPRLYCDRRCRDRAYEKRRRRNPSEALRADMEEASDAVHFCHFVQSRVRPERLS